MDKVYFKITIDNVSDDLHRRVMTSFKEVRWDFVKYDNGTIRNTYEVYDRCYFDTSKGIVGMYSCDSNKHFILTDLSNIWISVCTL